MTATADTITKGQIRSLLHEIADELGDEKAAEICTWALSPPAPTEALEHVRRAARQYCALVAKRSRARERARLARNAARDRLLEWNPASPAWERRRAAMLLWLELDYLDVLPRVNP
jgi:hypothetical protein